LNLSILEQRNYARLFFAFFAFFFFAAMIFIAICFVKNKLRKLFFKLARIIKIIFYFRPVVIIVHVKSKKSFFAKKCG